MESREFCPCETSRGPSMEEPPGAASLPGWVRSSSPRAVSLLLGLSLSPPRLGAQSGQCVQPAPSAGGFPPAPASAALGSAPPSQTQARYCEVTLARLRASRKGCWLCGVGGRRSPQPGGTAFPAPNPSHCKRDVLTPASAEPPPCLAPSSSEAWRAQNSENCPIADPKG